MSGELPIPEDDGAASHLTGQKIPAIALRSTDDNWVDLSGQTGTIVLYAYPRTGRPDEPESTEWNQLPGAKGCTPQALGFRETYRILQGLGARVYGLSTQNREYQREAVARLALPFPLLSDSELDLTTALRLPTFRFDPYPGESPIHIKRITLVIVDGVIRHVFYPVFPPGDNARIVAEWLAHNPTR